MKKMFAWFSPGGILFILIGCLLFVFVFFIKNMSVEKSEKCTFETVAVVETIVDSHNYDHKRTHMPVYSYVYNGEYFKANGPISQKIPNVNVGETVKFFIDPNDPTDYYCPKEEKGDNLAFIVMIIMGVALWAAGIDSFRKEYQNNTEKNF